MQYNIIEAVKKWFNRANSFYKCENCPMLNKICGKRHKSTGILPDEIILYSTGCTAPHAYAAFTEGETVLDLGSGGGCDAFLAARCVGKKGKVYGVDMKDEMLKLAEQNRLRLKFKNVEFIKGRIEKLPFQNSIMNVVISNCVICLSEQKDAVLKEAYRVLKTGGRLVVTDILSLGSGAAGFNKYQNCNAVTADEYYRILDAAGFKRINIRLIPFEDLCMSPVDLNFNEETYDFRTINVLCGTVIRAFK